MRANRIIYLLLFLICQLAAYAQVNPGQRNSYNTFDPQLDPSMVPIDPDSLNTEVEIISLPPRIYTWKVSERLGNILPLPPDTAYLQFQNVNLTEGINGHYNYLGNLGSPRLSRIFFERELPGSSLFLEPFDGFITQPHQHYFTNSNIPYTNITYHRAGNKINGEERVEAYFSVNVNKRFAFGFNFDYLYGRGFYQNQSTAYLKAGLFGSYIDDKYRAHILYNAFNMKMKENGGLTDDRYITDPQTMVTENGREIPANSMPVHLSSAWNYNKHFYVYLTHRYNLGFYRDIFNPTDSVTTEEFVPVTSFIHTAKVERSRHSFLINNTPDNYFLDEYMNWGGNVARDTTTYFGVKNTLGISLVEGFNKYAKAGLTAFISHKVSKYYLMDIDSGMPQNTYTEQEVFVGGELSKREGNLLHYYVIGEIGIAGKAMSQFKVNGDMDLNFPLGRDTVNFIARASITNTLPAFYIRHYHSKYYYWDNDEMDNEFRTRIEGELNINRWGTNLKAGVENIKNYTYFDYQALPSQHGSNLQVLTATLNQKLKLGILHFDNEVIWQKSSNNGILPLPDLSLYSNLYIDAKLAKKVLSLQLGADVRFFTKYYAPAYSPGIQQFHLQTLNVDERVQLGGYPIVNVYANFHLKRTRFFVMMYHVNSGSGNRNAFLVPHHPINQSLLKFGLSWNFFD